MPIFAYWLAVLILCIVTLVWWSPSQYSRWRACTNSRIYGAMARILDHCTPSPSVAAFRPLASEILKSSTTRIPLCLLDGFTGHVLQSLPLLTFFFLADGYWKNCAAGCYCANLAELSGQMEFDSQSAHLLLWGRPFGCKHHLRETFRIAKSTSMLAFWKVSVTSHLDLHNFVFSRLKALQELKIACLRVWWFQTKAFITVLTR